MNYFYDFMIPEIVRYTKIKQMNYTRLDEYGAAIFSTWYLLNPMGRPNYSAICNFAKNENDTLYQKVKYKKGDVLFTAHSHINEPHEPSPDDLLIYSTMNFATSPSTPIYNFITDKFSCYKID